VLRGIRRGSVITGTIATGKLTWGSGFELDLVVESINGDVRLFLEHEHRSSREPERIIRYCVDLEATRPCPSSEQLGRMGAAANGGLGAPGLAV
jgi:hypothetical protein